jgi:hypothetical protein
MLRERGFLRHQSAKSPRFKQKVLQNPDAFFGEKRLSI